MVHNEKLTVPPKTATPPPCKHKRAQTCENPIGARQARQQFSHRGDGNFARSLQHAPPVVGRSVGRSCASENQVRQQVRQHFSHRGDGKFAGVAGTYISLIEPNINPKRKMRVDLGMSAIFPSGRWELLKFQAQMHVLHAGRSRQHQS